MNELTNIEKSDFEKKEVEGKKTPFQSPVPLILKLRNFIFGKTVPDIYTRITFVINTVIWATFLIWHSISYFTISSRKMILQHKGIPVESIIERRGQQLDFLPGDFLNRLLTFHAVSIICWSLIFVGLVLLYRKRKKFIYFILSPLVFYLGMNMFYLSFAYFFEDTTTYDKIGLIVILASTILHFYLLKNEQAGGSISFFGEAEEDESYAE